VKLLDGRELAGYIEERQAKQVRALRQAWNVFPKLVIIQTTDNPVTETYVRLKQSYGEDILVDVAVERVEEERLIETVQRLNEDTSVHGIIIQLPLANSELTDEAVNAIAPEKDVDGLGEAALYISATATAIDWLLAGYNVELKNKAIAIVGNGRLVGRPLSRLWQSAGYDVTVYDDQTDDLISALRSAQVIVTATGVPGLITEHMLQPSAVVVDAGTASENGVLVGDVSPSARERNDLTITPIKGGVGPLTVTALFDTVIQAARATVQED
jgi:methylenetetrahydrofolate dehydrogenase (NADP+) / methenyltetrahydrofolate cyclohydrolase